MQKLSEVEGAKALLDKAAIEWSIWRWLLEKKRVRTTADAGTAALDELEKKVKATWSDDLKKAYRELQAAASVNGDPRAKRQYEKAREEARNVDPKIKLVAKRVKEADDIAYEARMDAEATFEHAERRLSTSMAREGALKAIFAYDVREKAIRKAEAARRLK